MKDRLDAVRQNLLLDISGGIISMDDTDEPSDCQQHKDIYQSITAKQFEKAVEWARKKLQQNVHKKPPAWQHSKARKILQFDMASGLISRDDSPSYIRDQRPEYRAYPLKAFTEYVETMWKNIQGLTDNAAKDAVAVSEFRNLHKPRTTTHLGEPRWEGHPAQQLMKKHFDEGKLPTAAQKGLVSKPFKKLKNEKGPQGEKHSNDKELDSLIEKHIEYQQFSRRIIIRRIHQEVRARKFLRWLADKQKDKLKELGIVTIDHDIAI